VIALDFIYLVCRTALAGKLAKNKERKTGSTKRRSGCQCTKNKERPCEGRTCVLCAL